MAGMRLDPTSLQELFHDINSSLLGWLQSKERSRLDELLRYFLSCTLHCNKFQYAITAHIIRESIKKTDFCGIRAAKAFLAIANYASNLLSQPWRQEFYEIKLYCGFYKHQVEEVLVNAEDMLKEMGYVRVGASLKLHGVLDPDSVSAICKDALVAQMECILMQKIWDEVSAAGISWKQIYSYREEYVGTPEMAIQHLKKNERERRYNERQVQKARSGYCDPHLLHHSMTYAQPVVHPCQQRYAQIVSPTQPLPSYASYQQALKPHDIYPTNGYRTPSYQQPVHMHHNGYPYLHQHVPAYSIPTTVPTGKLIELDSSPIHQPYPAPPYHAPYLHSEPVRAAEFPSVRAKNDGAGSWENWDMVYKNLDGYQNKTNGRDVTDYRTAPFERQLSSELRGMTLARPTTPPYRIENRFREPERIKQTKISYELGDLPPKQPKLPKKVVEVLDIHERNVRRSPEIERNKVNAIIATDHNVKSIKQQNVSRDSNYVSKIDDKGDNVATVTSLNDLLDARHRVSPEHARGIHYSSVGAENIEESDASPNVNIDVKNSSGFNDFQPTRPNVITLDVSPNFLRDVSPVVDLPPEEKWECAACTYLNHERRNACEICSKSRATDEIKPHPCGGKECPKCTLVNERSRNFCAACETCLKGSPTYI